MSHNNNNTIIITFVNFSDKLMKTEGCLVHEIEFDSLNVNFKDVLGQGAYGTVYKGKWVGTEVAVKVIKRAISYKNEVLKEAHLHATLRHPNIVTLMGVSFRKKDIAFVTELVNGNCLQYFIDEEITLHEETTSKVVAGIIKGVAYLHEVKVVHGDVKPANILVSQEMHAKICDFGIGKLKQKLSVTGSVTVQGSLRGTITFLPPECILNNKNTDFKSDIWSLGITLVEFLTLGVSWEDVFSDQSEESELDKLKYAMKARKLPSLCQKLPTKWKPLIDECLKYSPSERVKAKDLITHLK